MQERPLKFNISLGSGSARIDSLLADMPASPSPKRSLHLGKGKFAIRGPRDYGFWFTLYCEKHGLDGHESGEVLHQLYQQSRSEEEFVTNVTGSWDTVTEGEASYLYQLMSQHPEGPSGSI